MKGKRKPRRRLFTVVWEFRVAARQRRVFEKTYGPEGAWAQLFRAGKGYIRTELLRDRETPGRYLTIDNWTSRQAFVTFKSEITQNTQLSMRSAPHSQKKSDSSANSRPGIVMRLSKGPSPNEPLSGARVFMARPATPADIPAILSLECALASAAHWPEAAYKEIFAPDAPARIALVLEDESHSLHGFVIARLTSGECELENIGSRQICKGTAQEPY